MKSIAIITVAGLAATASAQSIAVDFSASATEINVGDTVSWTVSVSFTGYADASAYFGGFVGDFIASDNGLGTAGNIVSNMAGNATTPTANGASVEGINIFHSALLGTDDNSNPIAIMTFDVVADAEGILDYGAAGVWSQFGSDFIFATPDEFTNPDMSSDRVNIVPAPGALALVGLGGLVAARRRK